MLLRSRAIAAAHAAVTVTLLACSDALAAKEKAGPPPPQPSHGENTPLDLPTQTTQQFDATGASGSSSLVRTFVGLAVVIGVIYGLYWVLKQVKSSREERSSGTGLSSQAVVPLGPNRSLHLVRAGRELVLLGVAEHGVTPIRRYTEEEAHAIGLLTYDEPAAEATIAVDGKPQPMTIGQALEKLREWTVRK
jgi:flagellar protein FliO/FliZ